MFTALFDVGLFSFSIYTLLLAAASLAAGILGARVVYREQGSRISWWFFALALALSWWLLGRAMTSAALDRSLALAWTRFSYLAFPFIPAATLQFTYAAVGRQRKPLPLVIGSWSTGIFFCVLALTTNQMISGVIHYAWGFYPRYGPAGALFIAFFIIVTATSMVVLGTTIRGLPAGRQRSRLKRFAAGYAIGFVGVIDFLVVYGIPVVPLGHLVALASIIVVGSAIRQFQLFDITPAFAATNIVSTIQDGLIVADDEGHIRIVNDALCRLTGYAREDLLRLTMSELMVVPGFGDALLRSRNGESIPVSVSVSPLQDRERRVGAVIIAHDMRERLRIELAVIEQEMRLRTEEVRREAELQYRTLVESMSEGIVQVDRNNVVRYINDRATEMTGGARDEVIGQPVGDLFDGGFRDAFLAELRPSAAVRSAVELTRNGVPRWIEIVRSPIVETTGETVGSIGVLTDITDRRLFEQQLATSEREWRETFDAIQMPLVIIDGAGVVQRANRAARDRAGRDEVRAPVGEFGPGSLWREIERLVRSGDRSAHVHYEETDTGTTWDIVVDVIAGDDLGRQFVVAARDITAFVELQWSLRRSETMSALGALVGGVAHEVRNPLFAISSTLDVFEDLHGDRRELRGFLGLLREQTGRLSDLMSGLLELGRPAPVGFTREALAPIIEKAIALCADEARAAGVGISFESDERLPVISVDERRLRQAFRNILHNAVQHSPRGGTVVVRVERSELSSGAPGLLCSVLDEGPGFDPVDVPHVFEPFFTRRSGGTGLGLSITRAVVEQHQGTVVAGNRLEGGAAVCVELPVTMEQTT